MDLNRKKACTTRRLLICGVLLFSSLQTVNAQDDDPFASAENLKALSLEELMNIEVTLVSRTPSKLTEAASAIQVITRNDILRSGATTVPEALRLATNLQVAQLNSSSWIISARGFNTVFANKLLVMIDGRTVYTPLFAGVLWELQNVLLEDVDRIEVVSGPGGTLWGANAVNGVINIITRNARESQGTYVSALAGNFINHDISVRHGGMISDKVAYRVYAKNFLRNNTILANGEDNNDTWTLSQAGLRVDWEASAKDAVTFQGDVYDGEMKTTPEASPFDGQNAMARWTHTYSEKSAFIAQAYFDRYWRSDLASFIADQLQTLDFYFQHRIALVNIHKFVWGVNYRNVNDHFVSQTPLLGLLPARKNLDRAAVFVQDAIKVGANTTLTVGTKLSHNVYTGFEIQPSASIGHAFQKSLLWAAVSRAIRAPSRLDVDYYLPTYPVPPTSLSVAGGPNFESEKVIAYEAGYRLTANEHSTFSLASFYNTYADVYSVEALPGTLTYQIQNGSEAESWGAEFTGTYQFSDHWRLRGGYTYFDKDLRSKPGHVFDPSYLGNDARNQAMLKSMLNITPNMQFDLVSRYLDYLPKTTETPQVPEYFTFDARLALHLKAFEISVVGQNLWKDEHVEFRTFSSPRSFYGRVICRL